MMIILVYVSNSAFRQIGIQDYSSVHKRWPHKSERTDAASASLYSYPRDSNPRTAYKKLQKKIQFFYILSNFLVRMLSYFQKKFKLIFRS
jgi:hypothetical protein